MTLTRLRDVFCLERPDRVTADSRLLERPRSSPKFPERR